MNIKKAFTYIFSEKKWGYKIAIPVGITLFIFAVTFLIEMIFPSDDFTYNAYGSYRTSTTNPGELFATLIVLPFSIISGLVNLWYYYENAQAEFQSRETNLLTEVPFSDSLKKAGKLYLINLVVSFAFFIMFCILFLCLFIFVLGGAASIYSLGEQLSAGLGIGAILLICALVLFLIAFLFVIQYMVLEPSYMRVIYTNTFSEGLRFGENFSMAKRNFGTIFSIFLVDLAIIFVAGIIFVILGFLAGLLLFIPILGQIVYFIVFGILTVLVAYWSTFVRPNYVAQAYESILKEELKK